MAKWTVGILIALLASSTAFAHSLDIDYFEAEPNPTMTLTCGLFIPGGGFFYTANHSDLESGDALLGFVFLGLEVAGAISLVHAIRTTDSVAPFLGAGLFAVRFGDVYMSVDQARSEQLASLDRIDRANRERQAEAAQ